MRRTATSLGDKQVGQVVQRGTAIILTIMQEETVDVESGFIVPAKSITVDNLDGLKNLRDLLNKALPVESGAQ